MKTKRGGKRENSGRKATGRKNNASLSIKLMDWQKLAIQANAKMNNQTMTEYLLNRCLP